MGVINPELVFLHIPKAAGTSLHASLNHNYGNKKIFWFGEDCPPDIQLYPSQLISGRLIVGGHKPLGFYPKKINPLYCAILREPVERAISLFEYYANSRLGGNHSQTHPAQLGRDRLIAQGFDPESMHASLKKCSIFRRDISNQQCAYLSAKKPKFRHVKRTMSNHDFLIGTMPYHEKFHEAISKLLDWKSEPALKINQGRHKYFDTYTNDTELIDLIRELNTEDTKLYNSIINDHGGLFENFHANHGRLEALKLWPIRPWRRATNPLSWKDAASQIWPAISGANKSPWPLNTAIACEHSGLIYFPVPGPLNTSFHSMLVTRSSLDNKDELLDLGAKRVISNFRTGLLLAERAKAEQLAILSNPSYFQFSFMYEPMSRVVDTYIDKFVVGRRHLSESPRLVAFIASIQRCEHPDLELGITFREFVTALSAVDLMKLPPILRPQHLFYPQNRRYLRLYRQDQIPKLLDELPIEYSANQAAWRDNTLAKLSKIKDVVIAGENSKYADSYPKNLPANIGEWRDNLVDVDLQSQITTLFHADYELYHSLGKKEAPEVSVVDQE